MSRALLNAPILLAGPFLAGAVLAGALGCTHVPPPGPTGEDGWGPSLADGAPRPRPHVVPRALPIPEGERKPWEHAAALPSLTALPHRSPSEHLEGLYERTVLVNEAASGYALLTLTTALAPGALLVQRHHRRGSDEAVSYFVMERLAPGASRTTRDWRFLVVDTQLRVAATSNLELCARCHADAPFDGLFGLGSEHGAAADQP